MNKNKSGDSCVETPAPPEWLSKLESRREKLTKSTKLGHESGAGAPCNVCGSSCPGLDLHFWRKVCRNCKCRKDQHLCNDDDLSGWAQFEILGQIRSKPAYMKIKALADQPVKLEWIPPNATPDVISDYMDNLGSNHIPVAGSDAATKRKQQLEFQVPPHDLDATLCDNLTESETAQLQQYVKKVRENCVGQGNVVRVGVVSHGIIGNVADIQSSEDVQLEDSIKCPPAEVLRKLFATPAQVINDRVVRAVLNSQNLVNALLCERPLQLPNQIVAFERALSPDFNDSPLSEPNKVKLRAMHLNTDMVKSLVENGPLYDNILNNLRRKRIDFSHDPILVPIEKFRVEYMANEQFKQDMDKLVDSMNFVHPQYATPIKTKHRDLDSFHSPIPLRNPVQTRMGSLMKQETPMRKVKFGGVSVAYDLGLPVDATVERDPFFSRILNSEALQNAVRNPASLMGGGLVLSDAPMIPDFGNIENLSLPVRRKLDTMGVNQQAVQSAVVNGPIYDKLFDGLRSRKINYPDCKLLAPIDNFRDEFIENVPFQKEISKFVETLPNNFSISYSEPSPGQYYPSEQSSGNPSYSQNPFKGGMHGSKSSDSGFESKPPTPNYTTFPGAAEDDDPTLLGIGANAGKLSSIPGLDEMNMYPQVRPTKFAQAVENLPKGLESLQLSETPAIESLHAVPVLKCRECNSDIMSGEVAVKAERAGKEVAWHPQCFVCHKCRELLADLVYFFHGNNVYCGRDLALILKIPRCNACDELIFTKEYTAAEGATFHIKHFCCYQCDLPLAGQQYVPDEKTNMPLCLRCYDEYYAERCQFCKHIIGPAEQGVAWGKVHWHGECFMCAGIGCGKSLIGGRFCVKNDMPFCSPQCVKSVLS